MINTFTILHTVSINLLNKKKIFWYSEKELDYAELTDFVTFQLFYNGHMYSIIVVKCSSQVYTKFMYIFMLA